MSLYNLAAIQMVSGSHVLSNIASMKILVQQAIDKGANLVLLPEY